MNDYERIAEVIRYLDEHHSEQPDLASMAERLGLSSYHFHRLFSSWAGITPKDFLQCLTVRHAKERLKSGANILETALESGLSGPGRLHDLCVGLESATPGEIKSGGAGLKIVGGFTVTPFGLCLIAQSPRGICHLSLFESGEEESQWSSLLQEWPNAAVVRDDRAVRCMAKEIFVVESDKASRPLRAYVRGTPFRVRVWRALIRVPAGHVVTYGQLATAIGEPTAARAVGAAVGQNALAYLIPCHRVIRSTGVIGEYRWGGLRKRAMLAWEARTMTDRPVLSNVM
jgi:AraC family transcriptional regulator of adaptative response/methylated-DNA-[protein]-cysteine methyltransferase